MHGIKRQRISKDAELARQREEAEQIATFRKLDAEILDFRDKKSYPLSLLTLTESLLSLNPEHYTAWTLRRQVLLHTVFPNSPPKDHVAALKKELNLTMGLLRGAPKSYWVWGHRMWCLKNIPEGPGEEGKEKDGWRNEAWGKELAVTEKMLEADARNFHVWDYYRYVLSSLPSTFHPPRTAATEIRFTTRKIEANFSNYSAWHQRGKVVEGVWKELEGKGEEGKKEKGKMRDAEFELVTQALWVDPKDQSGWLYHRWLIGDGSDTEVLKREIVMIKELLEAEPDAKWPLESLSHYSMLLARQPVTGTEDAAALRREAKGWLEKLVAIDPFRKERYKELAAGCDA